MYLIFFNMKVFCVLLKKRLNEAILMCTHNISFSIKMKIILVAIWFSQGTQERQNSRGKRAISVRAIEVLL